MNRVTVAATTLLAGLTLTACAPSSSDPQPVAQPDTTSSTTTPPPTTTAAKPATSKRGAIIKQVGEEGGTWTSEDGPKAYSFVLNSMELITDCKDSDTPLLKMSFTVETGPAVKESQIFNGFNFYTVDEKGRIDDDVYAWTVSSCVSDASGAIDAPLPNSTYEPVIVVEATSPTGIVGYRPHSSGPEAVSWEWNYPA
ncbi:hypothetical protein [Antrihabitans spumae]|uniref:Lipoprotein n=1 Tax=Antrihabitans spumae TaxID=3373370 RepID=A0ABW7KLY9_9NOCA